MGLVFALLGIGLILIRDRFISANAAASKVFFGKWDPYQRWQRATRAYSMFIIFLVGGSFIAFGMLILLGIVTTNG